MELKVASYGLKWRSGYNRCRDWYQVWVVRYRDSRRKSLNLSAQERSICGLLKLTLWFGLDWRWLQTRDLGLDWCLY